MAGMINRKVIRQNVLLAGPKSHKESHMTDPIVVVRKDHREIQEIVPSKDLKDHFVMQIINLAGVELKSRMMDHHQKNRIKQKGVQETLLKNLSISHPANVRVKADLLTDHAEKAVTGHDVKRNRVM
jgi:NAD dependent epimerase/dehydratase family enzyme